MHVLQIRSAIIYIKGQAKKQKVYKFEIDGVLLKIVQAVIEKNDEVLRVLVEAEKLFEMEFRCHDKCLKDYNRPEYDWHR